MSSYKWYKEQTEKLHEEYRFLELVFDIVVIVLSIVGIHWSSFVLTKVAFASSILLILLGLRVNAIAINRQTRIVYLMYVDPYFDDVNRWIPVVKFLNWASFLALFVGVVLLVSEV